VSTANQILTARIAAAESGHEYSDIADRDDQVIVDYAKQGTKPPSDAHLRKVREPQADEVITDGRVPSPAERQHRHDMTGIPNAVRRDRVPLDAELARQQFGAEDDASDMMSWDEVQSRNARQSDSRMVSFHIPAPGSPSAGAQPLLRMNHLGQSVPRSRRWG
jgi:hypothetical protein